MTAKLKSETGELVVIRGTLYRVYAIAYIGEGDAVFKLMPAEQWAQRVEAPRPAPKPESREEMRDDGE